MKILMTGASGLVGTAFARYAFEKGHDISFLARNPERTKEALAIPAQGFKYDPLSQSPIPAEYFKNIDVVINLAGHSIAEGRWNELTKQLIFDSRILTTKAIVDAIRLLKENNKPKVFISASAVGYYGDQGDRILTEESPPNPDPQDFLSRVCQSWEKEAMHTGIRTIIARLGMVLSEHGGALKTLLPLFKFKLGGTIGKGTQNISWIHIDDVVRALFFFIENKECQGAYNLASPKPVTNKLFTKALSHALKVPHFFPVPSPLLNLALGEKSKILLSSQKASPQRLLNEGFQFDNPGLDQAFKDVALGNVFESVYYFDQPLKTVFSFFCIKNNLEKISPPSMQMKTNEVSGQTHCKFKIHGIPLEMDFKTTHVVWGTHFKDNQVEGPFKLFEHDHYFISRNQGTLVRDKIRYDLPLGILGQAANAVVVQKDFQKIFRERNAILEMEFSRLSSKTTDTI